MMHRIKNKIKLIATAVGLFLVASNGPLEASSSIFFPFSFLNRISFFNTFSNKRQKILSKVAHATHFVSAASVIAWMLAPGIVTPTFLGGSLIGSYLLQRHLDTNKLASKIDDVDSTVKAVGSKVTSVQITADRIEKATKENGEKLKEVGQNVDDLRTEVHQRFNTVAQQSKQYHSETSEQFVDMKKEQQKTKRSIDDLRKDQQETKEISTQTQTDVKNLHVKFDSVTEDQKKQMVLLEKQAAKNKQRREKDKKKFAEFSEKQDKTYAFVAETKKNVDGLKVEVKSNHEEQKKNTETLVATTLGVMGAISKIDEKQKKCLENDEKVKNDIAEIKAILINKAADEQQKAINIVKASELQTEEVLSADPQKLMAMYEQYQLKSKCRAPNNVEEIKAGNSLTCDSQMHTGKNKKKR